MTERFDHPDLTQEVLDAEAVALASDRELYMECMNGKGFDQRLTEQEIRDGLIIFHSVYMRIKQ